MKRRPAKPGQKTPAAARQPWSWSWLVVAATLLIIPLLFDVHGKDNFRLPKELAFRASAIALLAVFAFWATRRDVDLRASLRRQFRDPAVIVTLAILAWTGISTLTSLNRSLSVESLITVMASAIFFFGCRAAVHHRGTVVFDTLLFAAIANAVLAILQRYKVWQPFQPLPGVTEEVGTVAFLGNSNDVGNFLVLPAAAGLIAAAVVHGRRRIAYGIVAAVLLAGLVASGTRTAIGAYVAAIIFAAIIGGGRLRLVALAGAAVMSFLIVWPRTEIGSRYWSIVDAAMAGDLNVALSERLPAFLTASEMFRDRPLVGTGPGTFKWLYMRYRLEITDRYPEKWTEGWPASFAEVHNDHLQVAAETGLAGYLLLLAAFVTTIRGGAAEPQGQLATLVRRFRVPLVVAAFIVMLAQFPLQLAAPRTVMLFFAALCTANLEVP